MKVEKVFHLFMTHGKAERLYAEETSKKHEDVFRAWLLPTFQDKEIGEITRADVLNFRSAMLTRGISVYRQYSILMALKLFLRFGREVLGESCLDPAEIHLPSRPRPKVIYLSNHDIAKMRDALPTHTFSGMRLRVLVEILLGTGLRIGEALALDREPFEQGANELEIKGKGGKSRVVFFTDETLAWIRRWLKTRHDSYPSLFITNGNPPRRMAREDVSRFFILLRKRAGIGKKLTPHILRHTFCTNLLNNGVDIMHIKELAGHSDIQITARYYLGVDRDALRKVVKRLNYTPEEKPMRETSLRETFHTPVANN